MKIKLLIMSMLPLAFMSCRKLTACVETETTSAKLGQDIEFHNCSIRYEELDFELGEDNRDYDEKDFENELLTIAYHTPGNYRPTMEASRKQGAKKDITSIEITIDEPTKEELMGEWEYYQQEEVLDGSFLIGGTTTAMNGNIDFQSDTTMIDLNGYTTNWSLHNGGVLKIGTYNYEVYKLYNGELILKEGDWAGFYYLHYYTKK